MQEILRDLAEAFERGYPFAYCRLVETRGSTPQKAGATMLVFPDGRQKGTLGGGCLEAKVKHAALAALADGAPRIETLRLDQDSETGDGAICGGKATAFIQPAAPSSEPVGYYQRLYDIASRGGGTEVIVFGCDLPDLPKASCFLFDQAGQFVHALRGPTGLAQRILDDLRPLANRPRAYASGGIAFLPTLPRCPLVVVGGGHIGKAVARLASELEFDIWVIDDRSEFVTADRFPQASRRIAGDLDQVLPNLDITPDCYCLILTRGHRHDQSALYHLAQTSARYIGMIGSRRKIKMIYDALIDRGISKAVLQNVYAPLGINIGSQTVPEIAISICAELIAHRNCGGAVPGRPQSVAAGD